MGLPGDHDQRMQRARLALDGLLVGDGFAAVLASYPGPTGGLIAARMIPNGPWEGTGDGAMARSVVDVLDTYGTIDQDALARALADRYRSGPALDYQDATHWTLAAISGGVSWKEAATSALEIEEAVDDRACAVRAAPLGAYFADDPASVARVARASAETTHARPEDHPGAIAVATSAAAAARMGQGLATRSGAALLDAAMKQADALRDQLAKARALLDGRATAADAERALAGGTSVVPFALFCAASTLGSFDDAMWFPPARLGEAGATRAIAGALAALANGDRGIPAAWLSAARAT